MTLFLVFAATLSAAPQLVLDITSTRGVVTIFPGSNGPNLVDQAYNVGTGSLNLSATVSSTWLAVSVEASQICAAPAKTCYPILISLNTATLPAGQYTGFITVADPKAVDSPQQITVTVNIAGIPSSLNFYLTPAPTGSNYLPSDFADVFTHGTVTGTATTQSGGNWLSFENLDLGETFTQLWRPRKADRLRAAIPDPS
jgi:hypothetical protein